MEKINLKGISEILSEKELKNVMGGGQQGTTTAPTKPGNNPAPVVSGYIDGVRCYQGQCYADFVDESGNSVGCNQKTDMLICSVYGGFTC
jgi:bacteriocin-like protein